MPQSGLAGVDEEVLCRRRHRRHLERSGYTAAQLLVQVLKQWGTTSRVRAMKQAASLKSLELPMLLPGIKLDTSATDYFPIKQMQMQR
jgi:branched-chain amino acid transport system substrate-binding protein